MSHGLTVEPVTREQLERTTLPVAPVVRICTHYFDDHYCGATDDLRLYLTGCRCSAHTPAALVGRAEAAPDPTRTLVALRIAAGLPAFPDPPLSTSALNDDRAIASGKRRASNGAYRAARAAEDARRARRTP